MEDFGTLSELRNQQRPPRRNDKTYGKKKAPTSATRAMHYDLFGGGRDENNVGLESSEIKNEEKFEDGMASLTILQNDRDTPGDIDLEPKSTLSKPHPAEHNPWLRGRRKPISQKKMAAITPEKLQALNPLLKIVEQDGVKDFQEFGRSMGKKYLCKKLGEGSYADVYELQAKDLDEAKKLDQCGGLIIKVVPFRITSTGNDDIVDLDAVTREIRLFQTVDALHGFVRCRGTHVVSGGYPDVLLEAFDTFRAVHSANTAQNTQPASTAMGSHQLYVILEMNHAGTPLGKLKSTSAFQVFDIFWKTAISLALAEREIEFEHRDLHSSNICWKPQSDNGPMDVEQEVVEEMNGEPDVLLGLSNLQITIIDYTLSRATIPSKEEGQGVIFDPMKYWDIEYVETPRHNETEKRQYRTYSSVRALAIQAEAEAEALAHLEGGEYKAVDKFQRFLPKSNVLWLRYVLAELMSRNGGGRGACLPGSNKAAKGLQLKLWRTLEEVEAYLKGSTAFLPKSADDFIGMAVEEGWLAAEDVAAFKAQSEE